MNLTPPFSSRSLGALALLGLSFSANAAVDFVKDIQPILEFNCIGCHRAEKDTEGKSHSKGGVSFDTFELATTSGDNGPALVPGKPEKSTMYTTTILPADHDDLMPPKKKGDKLGEPLPKESTDLLKQWIQEGAPWPKGIRLTTRKLDKINSIALKPDPEHILVPKIDKRVTQISTPINEADMKPYTSVIPGSAASYSMVPIPGGKFKMGSPASEKGRSADEGPQREVQISPFWMGKYEVTWDEYEVFMYKNEEVRLRSFHKVDEATHVLSDHTSRPSPPYVEMSFGMGKSGFPAISMTQHAANKYCEWLSAKTGHFYRLPTEAEWEYAARAGTDTMYFWGNDASKIDEYCWYGKNCKDQYQKVGTKKPNPWGLYDILGNVAEWTLDQYDEKYYATAPAVNPWNKAPKPYPHSVRGGSWEDESPVQLRVAARISSDPEWKKQDPQLPKSIWYHTDAKFLGFRIVRPLTVPSAEEMKKYWNSEVEKE